MPSADKVREEWTQHIETLEARALPNGTVPGDGAAVQELAQVALHYLRERCDLAQQVEALQANEAEASSELHRLAQVLGLPDEGPCENVSGAIAKVEALTKERDEAREYARAVAPRDLLLPWEPKLVKP